MTDPNMKAKVENLLYQWHNDTKFESSSTRLRENPYYQMLIELGEEAVPFLVAEMDGHLSHALCTITGENPVEEHVAGDMDAIASYWKEWLKQKNTRKKYPESHTVLGISLVPHETYETYDRRHRALVQWKGSNSIVDVVVEHSPDFYRNRHEYLDITVTVQGRVFASNSKTWEEVDVSLYRELNQCERLRMEEADRATKRLEEIRNNRSLFDASILKGNEQ